MIHTNAFVYVNLGYNLVYFPGIAHMIAELGFFAKLLILLIFFFVQAIEPLLVGENEKTLATCVNCLTKVFHPDLTCLIGLCLSSYFLEQYHVVLFYLLYLEA